MSETALLLRDSVAKVLSDVITKQTRTAAEQGDWQALWQVFDELGLPKLMLSEDQGGSAGGADEAFALIELLGQFAVPCPLAETIITAKLLVTHGLAVPDGVLTLAPGSHHSSLKMQENGTDWKLSGETRSVPWGHQADALALVAQTGQKAMLCIVRAADGNIKPGKNLAGEARDDLSFTDAPIPAANVVEVSDSEILRRTGALVRSAQIAGALGACLSMTSQYAQERTQFGRPLSKFQAIQQQLASFTSEATAATTAARRAFSLMDHASIDLEVAAAKIYAGRAATQAAAISHQVHGAIGFTREYDLQHLTRRLWSWREEFGNESWWSERLGRQIAAGGADAVWAEITRE